MKCPRRWWLWFARDHEWTAWNCPMLINEHGHFLRYSFVAERACARCGVEELRLPRDGDLLGAGPATIQRESR